jgi:hypothetical protein
MSLSVPGSDFYCIDDIDPALTVVSGNDCLGQALVRRIGTPRLMLFYDPDYGIDARRYLGRPANPNVTSQAVANECLKDERVEDLTAGVMTITLHVDGDDGPFALTVLIDDLSTTLLDANI